MHNNCNQCNNKKCFSCGSQNRIACGDLFEKKIEYPEFFKCPQCNHNIHFKNPKRMSEIMICNECNISTSIYAFDKKNRNLNLSLHAEKENGCQFNFDILLTPIEKTIIKKEDPLHIKEPQEDKGLYGYWGKYESYNGTMMKKVWIGPMSKSEMINNHDAYRHFFRECLPKVKQI